MSPRPLDEPSHRWSHPAGPSLTGSLLLKPLAGAASPSSSSSTASPSPTSSTAAPCPTAPYYETDAAAAQFDYGVDDPSLLPEQPDAGVQEPDATVDDDPYYTGGAYYYVLPADDDLE